MDILTVPTAYLAVAVLVAGHTIYAGILRERREPLFRASDHALLTAAAAGVGAVWILFTPAMLMLGVRKLASDGKGEVEARQTAVSVSPAGVVSAVSS